MLFDPGTITTEQNEAYMSARELTSCSNFNSRDTDVVVEANPAYGRHSLSKDTEKLNFDQEIPPEYSSIVYGDTEGDLDREITNESTENGTDYCYVATNKILKPSTAVSSDYY